MAKNSLNFHTVLLYWVYIFVTGLSKYDTIDEKDFDLGKKFKEMILNKLLFLYIGNIVTIFSQV